LGEQKSDGTEELGIGIAKVLKKQHGAVAPIVLPNWIVHFIGFYYLIYKNKEPGVRRSQ